MYCAGRTRIVACEGNPNSGEFEIGTARFYDIIKTGESLAHDTNGCKLRGDSPVALSVADLKMEIEQPADEENPYI